MVYFTGLLFDEDVTASLEGRCLDKVVVSGSGIAQSRKEGMYIERISMSRFSQYPGKG